MRIQSPSTSIIRWRSNKPLSCRRRFRVGYSAAVASSWDGIVKPAQLATLRNGLRIMALQALGDADVAQDVAQEALVRALAAIEDRRLADPSRLGAFVRG